MIRGLVMLLSCQLAGEVIARGLSLPVPGPVVGLVLLLIGLHLSARQRGTADAVPADLTRTADGLLANLALLFVPAGVGVVKHLDLLAQHGVAVAAALVVSTAVTLTVTALTFSAVARRRDGGSERRAS